MSQVATTRPETADLLYTVPSIAEYLDLQEAQARHQIARGRIPTFRMGKIICSRKSWLRSWLDDCVASAPVAGADTAE